MKQTMKNLCCLISAIALLCCIIAAPIVWFAISDRHLYAANHPLSKVDFSLSSEISDIPLVYRIHKLLGSYYGEEQGNDSNGVLLEAIVLQAEDESDKIEKCEAETETEFAKLTQYENLNHILTMFIEPKNIKCTIKQSYGEYDIIQIYDGQLQVQYDYDVESEKILRLSFPKTEEKQLNAELKKKVMKEFITYLNLDILEDWYENGDSMISNKAHLSLSFQENEEQWVLGFSIV